ncbi:uncharacterized protein EKO05_0003408 [Ascochyta rabiei]|uniref:Uncharacterized protein n=1 Tax=Didymella rabiei TaxID=5454 RepID=A0A163EAJ1_DIDRA|nr:uncharacterized protein EKO05_0003408 [Ascochyta rabiei]KZM23602.1 hypothetical protein ST47_g5274 [Ascochyta rabiei]UPX12873.1 hypothetical protein EKO05_0003408 [Ascochyta rabiei]
MPQLVISAAVSPFGPQISRLPDELIFQIFKQVAVSMFPPKSRFNTVITPKNFAILNQHYAINRIRNVSTGFAVFFMQAFYENYTFSFKHCQLYNYWSLYLTSLPAPLPRRHFRHHLRSMHIEIVMENYFFTAQEIFVLPTTTSHYRTRCKITSAEQLLKHSPAARQLHGLTDSWIGFSNLTVLNLHIRSDFRYYPIDDEFLAALEDANLVVTAGKVELVVTDDDGNIKPEHLEVKKRIVVEGGR